MKKIKTFFQKYKHHFQSKILNKDRLVHLLKEAEHAHILSIDTEVMLESVIQFSEMQVRDIMLPRAQMVMLKANMELHELVQFVHESGHSRYPVVEENRDEILGILHVKNLLAYQLEDAPRFNLLDIVKPAMVIPESKRCDILLKEFRRNRNHMAVVVDEYGQVGGFVTIEDLIEQIVGDIEDEFDIDEDAFIKKHKNNQYILKAHMPIEEFNEYFDLKLNTEEFDTIGGFILKQLAHMPKTGEQLIWENYHFTVINSDTRRLKLLRLKIQEPITTE